MWIDDWQRYPQNTKLDSSLTKKNYPVQFKTGVV